MSQGNITSSLSVEYLDDSGCVHGRKPFIDIKFWLVSGFGTSLALISLTENVILLYILLSRKKFRTSNLIFLSFLAVFDLLISACYILLLSLQEIWEYFEDPTISRIWHFYFGPVFAVSHYSMTTSSFMIVAATTERYMTTSAKNSGQPVSHSARIALVVSAILMGVLTKGTFYWEYRAGTVPQCTGLAHYTIFLTPLTENYWFSTIYLFWIRNILTVFLPFAVLSFMNIRIVYFLRTKDICGGFYGSYRNYSYRTMVKMRTNAAREVRRATRMMILVVTLYLITNVLSVIITTWEHIDRMNLILFNGKFYTFATDVVSLLTLVSSASHFPIYLWCNREIRSEFLRICYLSRLFIQRRKLKTNELSIHHYLASQSDLMNETNPNIVFRGSKTSVRDEVVINLHHKSVILLSTASISIENGQNHVQSTPLANEHNQPTTENVTDPRLLPAACSSGCRGKSPVVFNNIASSFHPPTIDPKNSSEMKEARQFLLDKEKELVVSEKSEPAERSLLLYSSTEEEEEVSEKYNLVNNPPNTEPNDSFIMMIKGFDKYSSSFSPSATSYPFFTPDNKPSSPRSSKKSPSSPRSSTNPCKPKQTKLPLPLPPTMKFSTKQMLANKTCLSTTNRNRNLVSANRTNIYSKAIRSDFSQSDHYRHRHRHLAAYHDVNNRNDDRRLLRQNHLIILPPTNASFVKQTFV